MNILIDFLVSNFNKKFGLHKEDLEQYFHYQTNNSGVVDDTKLLIANNEERLRSLIRKITNNKVDHKNIDILLNKVEEKYGSVAKLFDYINNKINLRFFEDLKDINQLKEFKLNFLELLDELLLFLNTKPKVKKIQLANLINILKDSNLLGNWTIKPDRHINCVVPLLSIYNKKMINLNRDKQKPDDFEKNKILPEVSKVFLKKIEEQKNNYKIIGNLGRKGELEKINIVLYAYDYCFQYNLTNEKKINPKNLDRTIFLYSSHNLKGYLSTHKFYEEFCNKVEKHYYKHTPEYNKHIELIHALSF